MSIFKKRSINYFLSFYFVFLFLIPSFLFSGDFTADFLNIGVGARALGMGGAFCSVANDASSFYWNPAGVAFIKSPVISGMYGSQFGTFSNPMGNYHYFGCSIPLSGNGVIGFNWIRLAINDIPLYSELNGENFWDRLYNKSLRPSEEADGYINDVEDCYFFSFALLNDFNFDLGWDYHKVRIKIPLGVNIKWIRQSIGSHSAKGIGIDIGSMLCISLKDFFQTDKLGWLNFGLNIQDIARTSIKWDTKHADVLPVNYKFGVSYLQSLHFLQSQILFSYEHNSRWRGERSIGAEYQFMNTICLRAGLHNGKFTGGAGIKFWKIKINYAFLSHELDSLHRISFSFLPKLKRD